MIRYTHQVLSFVITMPAMTLTSHRLVVVTLCGRNIERLYSSLPSVSSRDVDGFGILIISCLSLSPYGKAGDVAPNATPEEEGEALQPPSGKPASARSGEKSGIYCFWHSRRSC